MFVEQWHEAIQPILESIPGAIPTRADLGKLYPWQALTLHSQSRRMQTMIDAAKRHIDAAVALPDEWRIAWSAGKDSTALVALCAEHGWCPRAMAVKDDMDYPGEDAYVSSIADRLGCKVDIIRPTVSLLGYLQDRGVDLTEDLHSQRASLSKDHFYGVIDGYQTHSGHTGILLGLRAQESRGRKMNRRFHGVTYRKEDGTAVCSPLADWSTEDVHAYLIRRNIPILPVYLCIDTGMESLSIRKSWYVSGGYAASIGGHYLWLRRWWPDLWRMAASISGSVERLS